jgi:hypothetical protein
LRQARVLRDGALVVWQQKRDMGMVATRTLYCFNT